ncbi:MAG: RluA family pseudouridine synthase [Coriobacteriia bacterium]|nr:RluA family pseudouridine synthase [Coriobacteriia bacterium]
MPEYQHKVAEHEQGMRLDVLLAALDGVPSRAEASRRIEEGDVVLNDVVVTLKKHPVRAGDMLSYRIEVKQPITLEAEDIALDIRYEDEDIIVLSKQAGLVVHPADGHSSGTLVNALIAHCGYGNLALLQGDDRPGIVHRLDKDTSGLMLIAKRNTAGKVLQDDIRSKDIKRCYIALLHGIIAPDTGLIDAPLTRATAERPRIVVSQLNKARESVTTFSVLERFEAGAYDDGFTLVECELHTGRTHQIRVHMEYIGHPCVGDQLYGPQGRVKAQCGLTRQFLHSWHLRFTHPCTGALHELFDPLPAVLSDVLHALSSQSRGRTQAGEDILTALMPLRNE